MSRLSSFCCMQGMCGWTEVTMTAVILQHDTTGLCLSFVATSKTEERLRALSAEVLRVYTWTRVKIIHIWFMEDVLTYRSETMTYWCYGCPRLYSLHAPKQILACICYGLVFDVQSKCTIMLEENTVVVSLKRAGYTFHEWAWSSKITIFWSKPSIPSFLTQRVVRTV